MASCNSAATTTEEGCDMRRLRRSSVIVLACVIMTAM